MTRLLVISVAIALVILVGAALVLEFSREARVSFLVEPPNIGAQITPRLPEDQPLTSRLFLTGGNGSADDPYTFCLLSTREGRPSCLFPVALGEGPPGLAPLEWYEVAADLSPDKAAHSAVSGRLLSATPVEGRRIAGPAQVRESRFVEHSEALSNWAIEHGVSGYLRADGIYVWFLDDEAAASSTRFGTVRAIWVEQGVA